VVEEEKAAAAPAAATTASMASSARLTEILRRLRLPPQATQAELRKVYYRRAKQLHPDIAGEAAADEFRRLKNDYEEALRLMRGEGPTGGADSGVDPHEDSKSSTSGVRWQSRGFTKTKVDFDPRVFRDRHRTHTQEDGSGYHYAASGGGAGAGASSRQSGSGQPLTPAQWFRFAALVSGCLMVGSMLVSRFQRDAAALNMRYT